MVGRGSPVACCKDEGSNDFCKNPFLSFVILQDLIVT